MIIVWSMARRAPPALEPDLFSIDTVPNAPTPPVRPFAPTVPVGSPDMIPDDLERVIVRWSDAAVERLVVVVTAEARRRGLLPLEQAPKNDVASGRPIRQRRPEHVAEGLAPGQVSAIRAAAQAGVKPSKIAREFGLPLAAVKRVIAGTTSS
jgi:hypothetical protein